MKTLLNDAFKIMKFLLSVRTYSDFMFFGVPEGIKYAKDRTPEIFHRYVVDDIGQFENCTVINSPRACAYKLNYLRNGTVREL